MVASILKKKQLDPFSNFSYFGIADETDRRTCNGVIAAGLRLHVAIRCTVNRRHCKARYKGETFAGKI